MFPAACSHTTPTPRPHPTRIHPATQLPIPTHRTHAHDNMAGLARKRDRGGSEAGGGGGGASSALKRRQRGSDAPSAFERRRKEMEADEVDSDIDSDDAVGGVGAGGGDVGSGEGRGEEEEEEEEDSEVEGETVEEKRLRLARAYLKNVGLDPDAGGDDEEGDGAGEDEDGVIGRLQDEANKSSGRTVTEVADFIRGKCAAGGLAVSRTVSAHGFAATCVAISSDEERAASGGKDAVVFAWDVETGRQVAKLAPQPFDRRWRKEPEKAPGHVGHVRAVAVADGAGGNVLASGGVDGMVRVWDVRCGKQVGVLRGHRGEVNGMVFRRGTMQLFTGSADRTVKMWDVGEMAYVETLFGHGGGVCAVASFAKERAVSCGRDGTMRLYKVLDESQLVFRRALTTTLDALAMVNEQRFVTGGDDGVLSLWHVNKKRPVAVVENAHGEGTGCDTWVSAVAAGPNTDLAASGGGDGCVRLWRCANRPPALEAVASVDTGRGFVNGLAMGGKSRVLIAAVGQEPRLGRWGKDGEATNGLRFITIPQDS